MSQPFLGEIRMFGGNFAPRGWAMCNGQLMSIAQNSALFSILGTSFGGDGITTFGLPDLRGRAPLNQGAGPGLTPYVLGEQTGTENVTLLQNQMPIHTHSAIGNNGTATQPSPGGNVWASPVDSQAGTGLGYITGAANAPMAPGVIGLAGGNLPVPVIQPILCVTFIIALVGIFPSRN